MQYRIIMCMSVRWFCNPDSVRNVSQESVAVQLLVSVHRLRRSRPGHCVGRAAGLYLHLCLCRRPLSLCLPHSSRTYLTVHTIYFMVLFRAFVSELCQKSYYQSINNIICDVWLVLWPMARNPQRPNKQKWLKSLRQVQGLCLAKKTVIVVNIRSHELAHTFSLGPEFVQIHQSFDLGSVWQIFLLNTNQPQNQKS